VEGLTVKNWRHSALTCKELLEVRAGLIDT
jgi:hypothetical protein